jgi:Flp pilus assembly protein TadG
MKLRGERGQALLETALALPLVLLISVSIFEFGRAYQTWQVLTNASREAARIAILPGTTDADIQARVQQYLTDGQLPSTSIASTTVDIDRTKTVSIGLGTAPATQITVNYPFSFIVLNPVARLVVTGSRVGGAFTMSARAEMRNE